jgi:hypothetical protein
MTPSAELNEPGRPANRPTASQNATGGRGPGKDCRAHPMRTRSAIPQESYHPATAARGEGPANHCALPPAGSRIAGFRRNTLVHSKERGQSASTRATPGPSYQGASLLEPVVCRRCSSKFEELYRVQNPTFRAGVCGLPTGRGCHPPPPFLPGKRHAASGSGSFIVRPKMLWSAPSSPSSEPSPSPR